MGMLDGKPFIPKTGALVTYKHHRYVLKWTTEHGRALFSLPWGYPIDNARVKATPSYRLEPDDCCPEAGSTWHFKVISMRTQQVVGTFVCYMVRVNKDEPVPKRPWWHDYGTPFRRDALWAMPCRGS